MYGSFRCQGKRKLLSLWLQNQMPASSPPASAAGSHQQLRSAENRGAEHMIYMDYAATSWPKPPEVLHAMTEYLECAGGNPGRSGHRLSIAAGRMVYQAREAVAELFNAPNPLRVIFTHNVTYALNL